MKNFLRCTILLLAVGPSISPAFAAELRTTGFIDNTFPHWERNISNPGSDNDATRNHDQAMYGRTRGRMFFNLIANDDLRGVFAFELDAGVGPAATASRRLGLLRGLWGLWLRQLRLRVEQ